MKGSIKRNGIRTVIFALVFGIIAVGTWQTVSAKENRNENFLSSVFGSISNLFAENKIENSKTLTNTKAENPVIGTCDTAGPIEVESTGGTTTPTAYATLKAAFDAINAGTHTGTINIEVCGNTTETASAVLNSGEVLPASYSSVIIRPVGAARIIEGSIVGAIIKLNGADNVTIDGRQGGTGTARDLTVRNNSTAAATAAVWLASVAAGNGATTNTIRNLQLAGGTDTSASANSTFGIIMSGTTVSATSNGVDNDNNSFIANRIVKVRYGIVTRGTTTNLNENPVVTDNIVGPSAFGTDQINKTGIYMQADTGALVSRNTVQFVGCLDPQACTGADRMGIAIGDESWSTGPSTLTSNNYTVTKNIIHDIVEELTFSAVGLRLGTTGGGSATNNLVANNFIYNVRGNGTGGDQVVGLGISGGHTDRVVFNSISMTGDVDPGVAGASTNYGSGIRIGVASSASFANLTLMNNSVYMDLSSSSTAANRYYAISGPSNAFSFGTGGENYNNYYINPANTQLQTGGLGTNSASALTTQFATLMDWQGAYTSPQDANSIQADPQYVSNTADLHIAMASPNVNAGTTIAGIIDDIDGQLRVAAPDIGADEPAGLTPPMNDISATAIVNPANGSTVGTGMAFTPKASYTNIGTNAQTNVTVRFRILDPSAMEIYNQTATITSINPGASTTVSFPSTSVASAGTYTTIASAELAGDENTSNDSVNGSFNAVPPLSGSVDVGAGETFTSLTNPGGVFEYLNSAGASGNVQINITSDLTGETGSVALNELAGGFSVTIRPSGEARSITGSTSSGAIIRINGADNVTIDGSLPMFANVVGGNPAIRNLTVQNTSTTATAAAVIAVMEGSNGAQNATIKNVNVMGQDPTQTLLGIHVGGNGIGASPATASNNNSRIENCSVQKAILGIFNNGLTATPATGTVITMNDLSATGANRVRRGGIFFFNQDGIQVTENSIGGIDTNEGADAIGIIAGNQNVTTTTVATGGVSNANISRNKINGVVSNSTTGFSAAGIVIGGGTLGPNTVANNMITGVTAPSTSPDLVAGIFVTSAAGSNTRLYYNSVAMTGDRMITGGSATQMPSFGIAYTADVALELKNNIFYTTQVSTGGGANAESYAIGTAATTFANLDSNYNDFWSTGANDSGFRSGSLGSAAGTDYANLTAWQAAVSDDANSQEVDPLFVSDLNDLHLQMTTPVENDGTPIAGITDDFDGNSRSATPEIGADELFVAMPGTLQFDMAAYSIGEGGGMATLTVTRTGGSDGAVTVDYSLGGGTATGGASCGGAVDYVNTGGTVMFADGETSKTFDVAICEDMVFEGDETFDATLSNATGGATIGTPSTATVTITENKGQPTVQFSSMTYMTTETLNGQLGGPGATINVTLSGASQSAVMVDYATSDGSATGGATCTAGVDYINASGTLTFNAGETNKSFFVTTCPDMNAEGDETVNLTLSNPVGATLGTPNTAVLTIVDNDAAGCSTASPIEVESTGGTMTPTGYATLKAAFDAINAGTHTLSINVKVCGDTTETATASLDASGVGSTSYTDVTVRPVGGSRTIQGNLSGTSTGAIVKLNGADNVTIDGRQGGTGTARDLTIKNNSNATGAAAVWLSSLAAGAGATDNVIRNLNLACGVSNNNALTTVGIIMSGTTISVTSNGNDNDNNQFIFNRITSARYGIVTRGVTTNNNIAPIVTDNIIGPEAGFGADGISKTGILMQADTGGVVSRNTVQFIGGNAANTTAGTDRVGIGIGTDAAGITTTTTITSGDYTVTKNIIHDVVEERTFSAAGIVLGTTRAGSPTNNLVANNFIYNVRANATSPDQTVGIAINGGNTDRIVFNSISLTGDVDPVGSSAPSTMFGNGIRIVGANGTNNANFTVANNSILVDLSSDTGTVHFYPITLNSAAYSFGTGFLNYNNYYINPSNPQLFTGGLATAAGAAATTEFATLANWQGALTTPQDANSIQSNPLYFSNTIDLHIQQTSPNIDAATPIAGITDDIDSQVRPNGANPDIGADEFYPGGGTIQLSSSSYSVSESGGMVTITVFRLGGANGAASVDYATGGGTATPGASCSAGVDYVSTSGTLMWADLDAAPKTFDVTICPDSDIEPTETFGVNLSNVTGATLGTPSSATVSIINAGSTINGTINVGTGETITSLTNPGGIFDVINNGMVTGNVTINITSDLTGETGTVALNEIPGGFTVLIKPSGEARTISGTSSATGGLIPFNAADNVTIDGSLSGGSDRSMTIMNLITGNAGGGIYFASGANGAQNNTVKNLNVWGTSSTGSLLGITFASSTFGGLGADLDNNRIENNDIRGAFYGVAVLGESAANKNTGTVITGNDFPATGTAGIGRIGIYVINDNGGEFTDNNIASVSSNAAADNIGIALGSQNMSLIAPVPADVTNALVARNYIGVVNNTVTNSSVGIAVASGVTGTNTVVNNMVTGVIGNADVTSATVQDFVAGIYVIPRAGATQNIYHNSVSMTGDRGTTVNQSPSYALAISADQPINVVNNILVNSQTRTGATGGGGESYAIGFEGPAANANLMSNFNDLFVSGPLGQIGITGDLTTTTQTTTAGTGTNHTTLANWQMATGEDANSISVDPLFVSTTDLHLQTGSPAINAGTNVGVTTDIDGDMRDAMPDIGADEVPQAPAPGTLQFSSPTYSGSESGSPFTVTVTRTGGSAGEVTVDYATSDGSATGGAACTAGVDYINNSGTLTFGTGVTSQTFDVVICNDATDESDETINYTLSNPTGGATIGTPGTAVQTIVDDDGPMATFTFSIGDAKVVEGNSGMVNAVFTVTLANIPTSNIGGTIASVDYSTANGTATAGSDYTATSGTLNFSSTGTMTISVPVNGDTVKESNEFFFVNLSNPSMNAIITDGQGAGIIIDEDRPYVADYDRDLMTDFSVYRPSNSTFYVSKSSKGFPIFQTMGATGDISVPGDYDGDGLTDFALFRPSTGDWTVLRSSDLTTTVNNWGLGTDKPVQGDYDGDGKTDLAVYRPSEGNWYILPSGSGLFYAVNFGISTDRLVQADYDGDFKTDVAVYRDGTWYALRSSDSSVLIQNWGLAGDKPAVGDFDSDGRNDLTVYRDGDWYIFRSLTNDFVGLSWGIAGDIPVPADYDGDGTSDVAVFRPSMGDWYVIKSTGGTIGFHWGQNGDTPSPAALIPQ